MAMDLKKMASAVIIAKLNASSFNEEEKKNAIETLKLRNQDTSKWEQDEDRKVLEEKAEKGYEVICTENDQKKVKALADLVGDKEFEELSNDELKKIVTISKRAAEKKEEVVKQNEKKVVTAARIATDRNKEVREFDDNAKSIVAKEETRASRTRDLYDAGWTVREIRVNTGWDQTNIYDTIKAYEKKKEKEMVK